jgi:hypothetical protein
MTVMNRDRRREPQADSRIEHFRLLGHRPIV